MTSTRPEEVYKIEALFKKEIKRIKGYETYSTPSELRHYVINEQVNKKLSQLRRLQKAVLHELGY